MRLRERPLGAACAGPCRRASPVRRLALPAPAGPVRLVDLATELVQALLDGVLRRRPGASAGCGHPPSICWPSCCRRLVDGVVLGIGRTHRAVFSSKTCDRYAPVDARAPEMAPVWVAGTRREPSERHPVGQSRASARGAAMHRGRSACNRDADAGCLAAHRRTSRPARWKDEPDPWARRVQACCCTGSPPSGVVEVLIAHPGGPFWARKDDAAWSVPKGEYLPGEDPLDAAYREFEEEVGLAAPEGEAVFLGERRQPGGKRVSVWALQGDLDVTALVEQHVRARMAQGLGPAPGIPRGGPGRVGVRSTRRGASS